jgi:hypothetical protein
MNATSNASPPGSARSVSSAGPSRSSIRSVSPALSQYFLATDVHSSLTSQLSSRPPGASPRAMQIEEYPVNVPTSTPARARLSRVSRVSSVPISGATWRVTEFGKRSAVSVASSRSTGSGGVLCAVR